MLKLSTKNSAFDLQQTPEPKLEMQISFHVVNLKGKTEAFSIQLMCRNRKLGKGAIPYMEQDSSDG